MSELAKKPGFGEYFWDSEEAYLGDLLKSLGITFKQLKEKKRALRGMMDFLPEEAKMLRYIERKARKVAELYDTKKL